MFIIYLALLVNSTAVEPEIPTKYLKDTVCRNLSDKIENQSFACEVEQVFRNEGFNSKLITAALSNSYAESEFNPAAVGDKGKSIGIFQLHENGLGKHMSNDERHDVKTSARRVIIAVRKSSKLTKAIESDASTEELTKLFCTEIMRPSDKYNKARSRVFILNKIFKR